MGARMRKTRFFAGLLLVLLTSLPFSSDAGQQPALTQVFERLQAAAQSTRSLTSDFVQEKQLAIFDEPLISQGRFFYRQPDQLRWELVTPIASGFVLNGRKGQRWNSLSREVSSFRVDSDPMMGIVAQQLLAWARVDIDWLKSRYRITLLAEQPVRLQLFPRNQGEAGFIEQMQILFAIDSSHVTQVEMFEKGGDKTRLRFEQVQINQLLAEDIFKAPEFR